ncbi:MAG TPA: hypothetical protein VJM11_13885 [Nevskiaceae bacterium]|nr:hypothetical protein [Nevskiaceae bacterium]
MPHTFLSDDWFAEYDRLSAGVEMPPALAKVVANLRVARADGSTMEARIDGGFIRKGYRADAPSTIAASEDLIFKAIVLGDVKSAMPAVFSGQIRIEGDKATLVKLALTPATATQQALTERVRQMTAT